ncbi:MAG: carotenoid oxygenase family protein, partial [Deltaproteobacteria bacterium]|nr:carotenoid oxygenase family protein [Deltaproteobacteria bacterium]
HDIAITAKHTILMDLPLMWDPALLARGKTQVRFYPTSPSRFGIIPRHGTSAEVRWFEAALVTCITPSTPGRRATRWCSSGVASRTPPRDRRYDPGDSPTRRAGAGAVLSRVALQPRHRRRARAQARRRDDGVSAHEQRAPREPFAIQLQPPHRPGVDAAL